MLYSIKIISYAFASFLALNTPVPQAPDLAKSQNVHERSFFVGKNDESFIIESSVDIKLILIFSISSLVNRWPLRLPGPKVIQLGIYIFIWI